MIKKDTDSLSASSVEDSNASRSNSPGISGSKLSNLNSRRRSSHSSLGNQPFKNAGVGTARPRQAQRHVTLSYFLIF